MPTGSLPESGKKLWEKVYNDAKAAGDSEEKAAKKAWGAVRNAGWSKDENGKWHKKAELTEFSMSMKTSYVNEEMRWKATCSNTYTDSYGDNMTTELFEDFLYRIQSNELAPETFRSDFWQGGMPYLSISHYPDLNGKAVPGPVKEVYIDGDYFKSKGTFDNTPLGIACYNAIKKEEEFPPEADDRVRVSIGFLDWAHTHKSNNYQFIREDLDDFCPECLKEHLTGKGQGLLYQKGQLVHFALTRVPVNKMTLMEVEKSMTTRKEDAASIVGDEQAEEIEEENKLVGKSEVLVVRAEDEELVEETKYAKEAAKEGAGDKDQESECEKGESKEDCEKRRKKDANKPDYKAELEEVNKNLVELRSEVASLKSLLETEPEVVEHPLDPAIDKLKADFNDAADVANLQLDERLQLLQVAFNSLGETIKSELATKSATIQVKEAVKSESENDEALQGLATVMASVVQKLDLLSSQLSVPKSTAQKVPAPRSIPPELVLQARANTAKAKSSIRELVERTT